MPPPLRLPRHAGQRLGGTQVSRPVVPSTEAEMGCAFKVCAGGEGGGVFGVTAAHHPGRDHASWAGDEGQGGRGFTEAECQPG